MATAAAVQPDVVLMDLHMPVVGGADATRNLLATQPGVKVINPDRLGQHLSRSATVGQRQTCSLPGLQLDPTRPPTGRCSVHGTANRSSRAGSRALTALIIIVPQGIRERDTRASPTAAQLLWSASISALTSEKVPG